MSDRACLRYDEPWLYSVIGMLNRCGGIIELQLFNEEDACTAMKLVEIRDVLLNSILPKAYTCLSCTVSPCETPKTIWIEIRPGEQRPYFDAGLGMEQGSFVWREGAAVVMEPDLLMEMIKETDGEAYEGQRSLRQNISLSGLKEAMQSRGQALGRPQMLTLGLIGAHGLYTNLACIFSDDYHWPVELFWIAGNEPIGRIIEHVAINPFGVKADRVFCKMMEGINQKRAALRPVVVGALEDFPLAAMSELLRITALLMDFSRGIKLTCCVYNNRLEMYAQGGPLGSVGSAGIYSGEPLYRNQRMTKVLERLFPDMVKSLTFSEYKLMFNRLPQLLRMEYDGNYFRITVPSLHPIKTPLTHSPYPERSIRLLRLLLERECLTAEEMMEEMQLNRYQITPFINRMLREELLTAKEGRYYAGERAYYPITPSAMPARLQCIPMPEIAGLEDLRI